MLQLNTIAADIFPEQALNALLGLGLKGASNWSLRAAGRRTTLLLVWEKDDNYEEKGTLKYRRGRERKQQRRENRPARNPPPTPQPEVQEESATVEPKQDQPVPAATIQTLQEHIGILSSHLLAIFGEVDMEDVATSPLDIPVPTPAAIPESSTPSPTPSPPPKKKGKGKGKKGVIKTSTPTPIRSLGPAVNLHKQLEAATPEPRWESPKNTIRMPEITKEDLLGQLCKEIGLELLEDKRKAASFISAVKYIGFRNLQISPPRVQQWYFALKILTRHYSRGIEERPIYQFQDAAAFLATRHGNYFPKRVTKEERTAAFLAEFEDRRGTFQPVEY